MKKRIMDSELIYFAKNGFEGTKISELAGFIGIGQGTLYSFFLKRRAVCCHHESGRKFK